LFVQPLEPNALHRRRSTCTTSVAAPVLDTLFVATNVISAVYVASQDNVTNKEQAVSLGLSVATLWALSAAYGYSKTSECSAWEAWEEGTGEAPPSSSPSTPRPIGYQPPKGGWSPVVAPPPAPAPPPVVEARPAPVVPKPEPGPEAPPAAPVPQRQDTDDPE
jgi:hypothetical protein